MARCYDAQQLIDRKTFAIIQDFANRSRPALCSLLSAPSTTPYRVFLSIPWSDR